MRCDTRFNLYYLSDSKYKFNKKLGKRYFVSLFPYFVPFFLYMDALENESEDETESNSKDENDSCLSTW